MMIRAIRQEDFPEIELLHEKFYKNEFDCPDFKKNTICAFVVEENGKILCAADIHTIAEISVITNKSISPFKRKTALLQILEAASYITSKHNYTQIHAFVQESIWKRALRRFGFKNTTGTALVKVFEEKNG